ncbi:sigma-70 family RNA polymerase sigma factor [Actinoplanes sp. NBC_00393]|uniref:sigma-70 family RNA polymerase sigma factor n=1 Tax=Actinoplanes sp. NBC_00393 TaxID=2975953 RepID=UPI003FA47B25
MAALVRDAVDGNSEALTAFVRATQRDLMRFLSSFVPPADVEDVAQETYLRAVGALPRFAGRSSVRTWLFAIARHAAIDHLRHAARRPRVAGPMDLLVSIEETPPWYQPRFEEHHALAGLIEGLAAERRDAFVLTQIVGLSYAEVAELTQCPIGTVRSRVARARDDLITALRDAAPGRRAAVG